MISALKRSSIRLDTHLFCRELIFIYVISIYLYIYNSNRTGVKCKTGTVNPSGALEFIQCLSEVRVA